MPIFDKNKSKIKMVVLRSGKFENITWFSILDKDSQSNEKICEDMLGRFHNYLSERPALPKTINKIHFYLNQSGLFIGEATKPMV